ncbi:MAG: hypothetical protein JXP34_15780 [Planctomycetes bacterium]|nr:hypothetical protein [Planctomycetota bacterium]
MFFWSFLFLAALASAAAEAPPAAPSRMPVKEVTVFKDGHAFVLQEGDMPVDAAGNVVLDRLPAPVLGTFWPYSADPAVKLEAVVAGRRKVAVERTAVSIRDLLEGNTGAKAIITETGGARYGATILGIPGRTAEETEESGGGGDSARRARTGNIILLETDGGIKAVNLDRIQDVTFQTKPTSAVKDEEFKDVLTLELERGAGKPGDTARVGMAYLQKGLRWIPEYRIDLDGKGSAAIRLQAALINELIDLEEVTIHLVIGVPTITFKDTLDPISLRKTMAQLSPYFREDAQTRFALSNAIMSQSARMTERRPQAPEAGADLGPEVAGAPGAEDLFVFTIQRVTLKKGERMVLPVTEFTLTYRDVYTLDLPFSPPPDFQRNINTEQARELARLFRAPKAVHKVRLENASRYPLTTAPALILEKGRVLAQGMMTYTSAGAATDLAITTAINIQVRKTESETKRTPHAEKWNSTDFARIDLEGKIALTSHLGEPVEIEVTRSVLGSGDSADRDGAIRHLLVFDEDGTAWDSLPPWWSWYSWPAGWHHLNGLSRITWKLTLEPGKTVNLGYAWHYYWP